VRNDTADFCHNGSVYSKANVRNKNEALWFRREMAHLLQHKNTGDSCWESLQAIFTQQFNVILPRQELGDIMVME